MKLSYKNILSEARNWEDIEDDADQWLAKFTYQNLDKFPSDNIWNTLIERYPIDKPTEVYRGINFYEKEQYDDFINQIHDNILTINSISSWGFEKDSAEQFAVTQPTYFLNLELAQMTDKKYKDREFITGYRGIIIKTIAEPNKGIDVRKSNLGHESEIILGPGSYKIEIVKVYKKYADHLIDKDFTVDQVILNTTKEDLNRDRNWQYNFLQYVLYHHKDKLSIQAKEHLFQLYYYPQYSGNIKFRKRFWDYFGMTDEKNSIDGNVYYDYSFEISYFHLAMENLYPNQKMNQVRKDAKKIVLEFIKMVQDNPNVQFIGYYGAYKMLCKISALCGMETRLKNTMTKHVSRQKNIVDSKVRSINQSIQNGNNARELIERHGEKIIRILKQILY